MNRVRLPVDHLDEVWPRRIRKKQRLGAVLHPASVNAKLEHTLDVLLSFHGDLFTMEALFGPQHGYDGSTQDNMIEWESFKHPELGIPVHSLYGEHREPTPSMLEDLDILLVDLVDVGSRYYTFVWTLFLCMKSAAKAGVTVVVCDRPNPINGVAIEGAPSDPGYLSFVGLHPLANRHARTIGELALQFQQECFPECKLEVLPMQNWDRRQWYDQTGLPWVFPSPNMPTPDTATVYPGMCLLEGTNLSEGRGTTRPFEIFGAPWIDARLLGERLTQERLPGVVFRPLSFEPVFQKHANQLCHGLQLHVTDREKFRSLEVALTVLGLCRELWPTEFAWNPPPYEYEYEKLPIEILLGGPVRNWFP